MVSVGFCWNLCSALIISDRKVSVFPLIYTDCHIVFAFRLKPLFATVDMSRMKESTSETQG